METAEGPLLFGIFGGGVTYLAGWLLNVYWPQKQAAVYRETKREAVNKELQTLGVSTDLGAVAGESEQERAARLEAFLDEEVKVAYKELRNYHRLFFIPVQWWGVIFLIGGLFAAFGS